MAIEKVSPEELMTDEEQARIKHLKHLLTKSDMEKRYLEKRANYNEVCHIYNTAKTEATHGKNSKAVNNWATNKNLLHLKVKAAMTDWVSIGYKDEFEQITAEISNFKPELLLRNYLQ